MNPSLPSRVAVVGLGYVGLPLACAFGRLFPTTGFDVNSRRVSELRAGWDRNGEIPPDALKLPGLTFTDDPTPLRANSFIMVTVPTPVDRAKRPDLSHLVEASQLVGQNLSPGTIVVYESTVYPGCTEEVCIPVLEKASGLRAGRDFKVGYSPERINPGDREHTLDKVVKVVSGQDQQAANVIASMYRQVALAGVYQAPDIRTAEAAKVIENVQRDLNIALMNELAVLFHRLGLNAGAVLAAARTKWNFLPFEPGLVGGHCIPVDPYYLTHKAQEAGHYPEVILAGRRINDSMGLYVAQETVRLLVQSGRVLRGAPVLVLGVAFKENVRDVRNSRVVELVQELGSYGCQVRVYDPHVSSEALAPLGLKGVADPFAEADAARSLYDAVVLAVPHRLFRERPLSQYLALLTRQDGPGVFVDLKGVFANQVNGKPGFLYWSL